MIPYRLLLLLAPDYYDAVGGLPSVATAVYGWLEYSASGIGHYDIIGQENYQAIGVTQYDAIGMGGYSADGQGHYSGEDAE